MKIRPIVGKIRTILGCAMVFGCLPYTQSVINAEDRSPEFYSWASTPPMGWNSWDCYGAGVSQADTLANADYMADKLKSHGWNIITIDIQWYEPLAHTTEYRKDAILETDSNGRLLPAPNRFPLTKQSMSFKPVADYLHSKGLRFGLHLLRGIPKQAVNRDNAPILGTQYHAADIADKMNVCHWNGDMYGVDMSKPGAQEYYNSVFSLLASWDLDFVKVDDLSGHDAEIKAIRKAIDACGRKIVFSVSPGGPSNDVVASNTNMWRISGDFWDNWGALYSQFARVNSASRFRGTGHWPDADMIPFGNITAWPEAKSHWTHFTKDEQHTLMSLWCIGRSPLMFGGNMPKNDDFTLSLMTNDEVIAVDQHSTNNRQVFSKDNHVVWLADAEGSDAKYIALFNANPPPAARRGRRPRAGSATQPINSGAIPDFAGGGPATPTQATTQSPAATQPATVEVLLSDLGVTGHVTVRDLWTHADLPVVSEKISVELNPHASALYRITTKSP